MMKTALLLLALTASAEAAPTFIKEAGIRLSSAAMQAATTDGITGATRFYYIQGDTVVYSATTLDDGNSFVEDAGIRISTYTEPRVEVTSITGLSIQPLTGGGYRMLYSAIGSTGTIFRIYSATSADGLAWHNDTGTRVDNNGGAGFVGYPSLVKLGTGDWRVYFIANNDGGTAAANRRVYTGLSANQGLNFAAGSLVLDAQAGAVAAIKLTDNKIRVFYTAPLTGETTYSTLVSALNSDGLGSSFSSESGIRLSTTSSAGAISHPFVLRSSETWRWRLYYDYHQGAALGQNTAPAYSASAFAPDLITISPNMVLNTAAARTFAVKGENLSPAPTLTLNQGGASIAGAAVTRTDDLNLSVQFNTQNQNLGYWNLTATNADGASGTLLNAVYIDFTPGSVAMTDNLMRPRQGVRTKIDITTFNPGRITAKLYTLAGDPIATLIDQDMPEGTTTLWWDGKTARGHTVASGVYLLHTVGQKLNSKEKIVVIK
ncbi:MAG: hypothetical protein WC881_05200 [Elusimicrobiota bacterium]|jgi:hypothetical protein